MIGLIQKMFMDMVTGMFGDEKMKEILVEAGLPEDTTFQINQNYPDDQWQIMVTAGMKILNLTPEQVDEAYAEHFYKDALKRFPTWFQMSKTSYDFLTIQPIIHNAFATGVASPEVRNSINDKFKIDKLENKIVTHYNSNNHHCGLYKALARQIINHFQDEATIVEPKCKKHGDNECEIHVQWTKLGGQDCAA